MSGSSDIIVNNTAAKKEYDHKSSMGKITELKSATEDCKVHL